MSVTFHKAFDQTRESEQALETLIALGVDRVLTLWCATAVEGMDTLKCLVEQARGNASPSWPAAGFRLTTSRPCSRARWECEKFTWAQP